MASESTIVLYHGGCMDGFGGAYAAYKKFGASARYLPIIHGTASAARLPAGIKGARVFLIDFCYPEKLLRQLQKNARSLTVLDHHITNAALVRSVPDHVFNLKQSGAGLAWRYFHPKTPVPLFLKYIEDGDLWNYRQPHSRQVKNLLCTEPLTFQRFGLLHRIFERRESRKRYIEQCIAVADYRDLLVKRFADRAELVRFGKHTVFAVQSPDFLRSEVGHLLAKKAGTFGIVWRLTTNGLSISLRGAGTTDVAKIAQKYGGGGHHNAAGFEMPLHLKLPFKPIRT